MSENRTLRSAAPVLAGTAVIISLSMGLKQSLSLFVPAMMSELSISVTNFALAFGIQNLVWGFLQPFAGGLAGRFGFRTVLLVGILCYFMGLLCVAVASNVFGIILGVGVLHGIALACTGSSFCMALASQPVSASTRGVALGIMAAAGSAGALLAAPAGQAVALHLGWRAGVWAFIAMALVMVPAALVAGRVDRLPIPQSTDLADDALASQAIRRALRNAPFLLIAASYFVCGLQLVFVVVHLPTYLAADGMSPMIAASALAVIGIANIVGSLLFGMIGTRIPKALVCAGIYCARSIAIIAFLVAPLTPVSVMVFAAVMGGMWLALAPLVSGTVAELFGLRWQAMIQGLALLCHQIGSFLGAYGGGLLFDSYGSYDLAWKIVIALGFAACAFQTLAWMLTRSTSAAGTL